MFKLLFILIAYCAIVNAKNDPNIFKEINSYFKSATYSNFQKLWQTHRKSYEHALETELKYGFGQGNMNIYMRRSPLNFLLSEGIYVDDNIVKTLLYNLYLLHMPRLLYPQVTFALAGDALRVESPLSTMIVTGQFIAFRHAKKSFADEDPYKTSPFNFPQVKDNGSIAIRAERCTLVGNMITKLHGKNVILGHDSFHVTDCQFSVEIEVLAGPPVIAPYFSQKQAKVLENLLAAPLRRELAAILQSAMYTFMNITSIFGGKLNNIVEMQEKIFNETTNYVTNLTMAGNKKSADLELLATPMDGFSIFSKVLIPGGYKNSVYYGVYIDVTHVTLYGLDSLYSAHIGGPYKLQDNSLSETLRFSSLMIRGELNLKAGKDISLYLFVAELKDVEVHVEFHVENYFIRTFEVMRWRSLEVSLRRGDVPDYGLILERLVVIAYIELMLPKVIQEHMLKVFGLTSDQSFNATETNSDSQTTSQATTKREIQTRFDVKNETEEVEAVPYDNGPCGKDM